MNVFGWENNLAFIFNEGYSLKMEIFIEKFIIERTVSSESRENHKNLVMFIMCLFSDHPTGRGRTEVCRSRSDVNRLPGAFCVIVSILIRILPYFIKSTISGEQEGEVDAGSWGETTEQRSGYPAGPPDLEELFCGRSSLLAARWVLLIIWCLHFMSILVEFRCHFAAWNFYQEKIPQLRRYFKRLKFLDALFWKTCLVSAYDIYLKELVFWWNKCLLCGSILYSFDNFSCLLVWFDGSNCFFVQ